MTITEISLAKLFIIDFPVENGVILKTLDDVLLSSNFVLRLLTILVGKIVAFGRFLKVEKKGMFQCAIGRLFHLGMRIYYRSQLLPPTAEGRL